MVLRVEHIVTDYNLDVIAGEAGLKRVIDKEQVSRPGMELAGLFDFYEFDRIQVMGSKEVTFFWWLSKEDQEIRTRMLFEKKPPMFIFSKNAEIPTLFIDLSNEFGIPLLKSKKKTSALISALYQHLNAKLSPRESIHGTLVDISGVGVLIKGKSGLGKSEAALELVRRGHQLVADDRVDIYQRELGVVIGEAPDILKKYLEIRGIGIVNVAKLFGVKAFKENKKIMLVVDLEGWDKFNEYDRLGLVDEKVKYFDTEVSYVRIPVTEGRNVASLIEVAAMNARLKFLGTNTAQEFSDSLDQYIKRDQEEE